MKFLCGEDMSALDQAIINENRQATKLLLILEKDINGLDSYGSTKLHSAILNERFDLIQILLDAGADRNSKDKWGVSAIDFAKR
ncbi:MAG: ankyrin repeat domain-containing protein [Leptospira sp.]|jgi:ankyrin repeat protein|nr:ankyrin repeat domain-containing protein [Leptospira sp.]